MVSSSVDQDGVRADIADAREQAELADNVEYDKPEARIWHCTAAIRRLADAIEKLLGGTTP